MLQRLLQAVQEVFVVEGEEPPDDLSAEHAPLVHVHHFLHLQPANRTLRREETAVSRPI